MLAFFNLKAESGDSYIFLVVSKPTKKANSNNKMILLTSIQRLFSRTTALGDMFLHQDEHTQYSLFKISPQGPISKVFSKNQTAYY